MRIMTVAVMTAMVLSGCSDQADWMGEWRGTRPDAEASGSDPLVAKSIANVKLTIKPDGHFDLTEEGFGKSGSAVLGPESGRLIIDTVLGRRPGSLGPSGERMAGERTIKMQKNGTILFQRPNSEPVVLKRLPENSEKPTSGAQ